VRNDRTVSYRYSASQDRFSVIDSGRPFGDTVVFDIPESGFSLALAEALCQAYEAGLRQGQREARHD